MYGRNHGGQVCLLFTRPSQVRRDNCRHLLVLRIRYVMKNMFAIREYIVENSIGSSPR